ncbi:hypothetical protein [Desertibaculum subflavum]|uniref:hypothetical protein n=1 Tax=Desertibaculum subflavum TaxID=2268458 RepID=UPI0013C4FC5D
MKLLLLLSDNFMRPRTRRHWDGLEDMLAHGVHADPYIGLFVALLEDPRFTATAVDVAALYVDRGPAGVVPALVRAAGDAAPDYVVLNIGNQPFCLSRAQLAALKARWPTACFILLTTDEAIDFRKVTWCYAEFADLILSLDGAIGWGTRYRERWCFMHLVSSELYRAAGTAPPQARPVAVGMFGRPKSGRHELIAALRAAGIEVDTNIDDETSWRRLDDSEYVERMRRTRFALVPLRIHGRNEFHLIGRLYEAVFAGAIPVVEACDLLGPYEAAYGRFLTYRTAEDVLRVVADPTAASTWSEMASATGLQERARDLGREAFFDLLAARVSAVEIRRRLGAGALAEAVAGITPQRPLRLGRLYWERVGWLWKALRRFRLRDAAAEVAAILGLLRAYFTYR